MKETDWVCNGEDLYTFYLPPKVANHLINCKDNDIDTCQDCFDIWATLHKTIKYQMENK